MKLPEQMKRTPSCVSDDVYREWLHFAYISGTLKDMKVNYESGFYRDRTPFCMDCTQKYADKMRAEGRCDYPRLRLPDELSSEDGKSRKNIGVVITDADGNVYEMRSIREAAKFLRSARKTLKIASADGTEIRGHRVEILS